MSLDHHCEGLSARPEHRSPAQRHGPSSAVPGVDMKAAVWRLGHRPRTAARPPRHGLTPATISEEEVITVGIIDPENFPPFRPPEKEPEPEPDPEPAK